MGRFWCNYCGMKLTKDSARVRRQHFSGKNHITNVENYWAVVAKELEKGKSKTQQLDQSESIRAAFRIPGLTPSLESSEVEDALDRGQLPPPLQYY